MTKVVAITGTDTGVGKTVVACAMAALARSRACRVAVMKPAESGVSDMPDMPDASDAERLMWAAGSSEPMEVVCPYRFPEPLAPMVAAWHAGVSIDLQTLDKCRAQLALRSDLLIVEGAGGLMVPLSSSLSYRDLFKHWQAGVVVVAANRLGVINHTLLTVEALKASGLELLGVVLTSLVRPDSQGSDLSSKSNSETLHQLLPSAPLFHFPWLEQTENLTSLAACAEQAGLETLLPIPAVHYDS